MNGGGSDIAYFRIILLGTKDYPLELHLKDDVISKALYGILVQGSYVTISGADHSTAPNADQQPVHTVNNTYSTMLKASTSGAGAIVVNNDVHDVKLVNIRAISSNLPGMFVDSSYVTFIGTNNPDPYLTTLNA